MSERIEQMYWVSTRGIIVTLPPPITEGVTRAAVRGQDIDLLQGQRLALIDNDSILRKRYPQSSDGCNYMCRVDLGWRGELLKEAEDVTSVIRKSVLKATGFLDEDFAIILFGSVAKGLSRRRMDEDPSNIDLSVIGNFSEDQRTDIFDGIRAVRERGRMRIGNNIGVFIQTPEKLIKDFYAPLIQFIGSCAYPLHDPGNIWKHLEEEALKCSLERTRKEMLKRNNGNDRQIRNNGCQLNQP